MYDLQSDVRVVNPLLIQNTCRTFRLIRASLMYFSNGAHEHGFVTASAVIFCVSS